MTKEWSVYEHIFQNGKRYIGISSDCENRWKNGKGYDSQGKIAKAIKKYGWENIRHNVIVDGLNKDQAIKLEMYLIDALNTIKDGYNTSIGGANINGTYLDAHVLEMINSSKRFFDHDIYITFDSGERIGVIETADSDRYDKDAAEFWNEACRAVEKKHGHFSKTDALAVSRFWFYMREYYLLYLMVEEGKDVSDWEEESPEQAIIDYFFKQDATEVAG